MLAELLARGTAVEGKYGLLARGCTVYQFDKMVDVMRGSQEMRTLFARLKIEAVLGHKEAVWMLWELVKNAKKHTAKGRLVPDEQIARQLEQEFGTNPIDLDPSMQAGPESPSVARLGALLGSIQDGVY